MNYGVGTCSRKHTTWLRQGALSSREDLTSIYYDSLNMVWYDTTCRLNLLFYCRIMWGFGTYTVYRVYFLTKGIPDKPYTHKRKLPIISLSATSTVLANFTVSHSIDWNHSNKWGCFLSLSIQNWIISIASNWIHSSFFFFLFLLIHFNWN
jgi:hypothetical protein